MLKRMMLKAPRQSCRLFYVFCLILSSLLFISCGGGGGSSASPINPASAKDITTFSILSVNGTIVGNAISVTVPNGANPAALVATFTTTGASVRVGATVQVSGSTSNNFTSPVTYTITAADASIKTYTVTVTVAAAPTGAIIADHTRTGGAIPDAAVTLAKTNLHIAYGHTSHGSQLITGMNALANANSLYAWNNGGTSGALDLRDGVMGGDVGYYPAWVNNTRSYLGLPNASGRGAANSTINVVIWSWCGQAAEQTQQSMIDNYLTPMSQLEADYWGIKFVYMTGHLDGGGDTGNLHLRNEQIRNYCSTNNKILFDFADIESYDPNGAVNYMLLDGNDNCDYDSDNNGSLDKNWATSWVTAYPGDALTSLANQCSGCAHSQGLNCALKGRAVWWLWARIAGWDGGYP